MKEDMINEILDIHTHRREAETHGQSIINYPLLAKQLFMDGYSYSMGIHPWELTMENLEQEADLLCEYLRDKRMVAIGEAGLDKLAESPMELQLQAFVGQVLLAEDCKLPLIIHCVKAMEELLAVKKQYHPQQPWIWHGFRGKQDQAVQLLKNGFYLSFGEHYQDEAMQVVPDDRLFLETDESSLDIEEILRRAARVRGVDVETLRETIRKNVQNVFFKDRGVASSAKESYFCPTWNRNTNN